MTREKLDWISGMLGDIGTGISKPIVAAAEKREADEKLKAKKKLEQESLSAFFKEERDSGLAQTYFGSIKDPKDLKDAVAGYRKYGLKYLFPDQKEPSGTTQVQPAPSDLNSLLDVVKPPAKQTQIQSTPPQVNFGLNPKDPRNFNYIDQLMNPNRKDVNALPDLVK